MMSITVSPEAEIIKDTISDMIEISKIDHYVLVEALCALVIEFADHHMEQSAEYAELRRKIRQNPKNS
ncbi:MAG: hypothetical protein FWG96_06190 [Methanomassiliicoccaceae archaeon]|nr:hypothetical protein [Methanomassiliicoccaceae archaeon]